MEAGEDKMSDSGAGDHILPNQTRQLLSWGNGNADLLARLEIQVRQISGSEQVVIVFNRRDEFVLSGLDVVFESSYPTSMTVPEAVIQALQVMSDSDAA